MKKFRVFYNAAKNRRLTLYRDQDGRLTYAIEEYIASGFEPHWTLELDSPSSWFSDLEIAMTEVAKRHPQFIFSTDEMK